jgi:hypothetical protein
MTNVEVNTHGTLRRFLPRGVSSVRLDLPEGTTVCEVIELLQAEHEIWLASIGDRVVIYTDFDEQRRSNGHPSVD